MRIRTTAAAVAVLGLALAGCADDNGDTSDNGDQAGAGASPTPTPDATDAAPAGQVASCVVGDWQSEQVAADAGGDAASVDIQGGDGVALSVTDSGDTTLDFAGMTPITFSGEIAGANASGELSYAGQATGTVSTGGADETSGSWEPQQTDWDDVRLTLRLTEPAEVTPFDDAPIGDFVEGADQITGDVVDVDPVLGQGSYECQGDSLVLGPDAGGAGFSWTFTRS